MSDRKYRQRGYQDDSGGRKREAPRAPKPQEPRAPGRQLQDAAGPRTPNLMASHEVFRCARCGNRLSLPVGAADRCVRCGVGVHSCINCGAFDSSARFECAQTSVTARVSPKDDTNLCGLFAARTTVERQTTTSSPGSAPSARQAFDDLFK
jgi:hypothetical protein